MASKRLMHQQGIAHPAGRTSLVPAMQVPSPTPENCTETQEENHDTQLFLSLQSTSKDASKPPVHLQGGMMEGRHTGYFFIQIFKLYQVPPFLDLVPFQNTFKLFMVHRL